MTLEEVYEDLSKYRRELRYWKRVGQSDGFDVQGMPPPFGINGLREYDSARFPCPGLVILYAKLGLHRYNFLHATKFQLSCVNKYNKDTGSAACAFFITLVAKDPVTCLDHIFQTKVEEETYGDLELTSSVARFHGTKEPNVCCDDSALDDFYRGSLPQLPPQNAFKDRKRFYMVKKSELPENDWIRLYLELAVATNDRTTASPDLSDLKTLKVAIETKEDVDPPNKRLCAENAIVYIWYKSESRLGKLIEGIAIVRRTFDRRKGWFSLVGDFPSLDVVPRKSKNWSRALLFRRRLGVHKVWRLSNPRHQAFKTSGKNLRLARHLR